MSIRYLKRTAWTPSITAMAFIQDHFQFVTFELEMDLVFQTDSWWEQKQVFGRLEFLETLFAASIFVSRYDAMSEILNKDTSNVIIECWDTPTDQSMATLLFFKANSILEDKATLTNIRLSHGNLENFEFEIEGQTLYDHGSFDEHTTDWKHELGIAGKDKPWYHRSDLSTNDYIAYDEDDEEYYIWTGGINWDGISLGWEEPKEEGEETPAPHIGNNANKGKILAFKPKKK